MFPKRDENECIDRYTGPYERWVFSKELGRPFTFPAIRSGPSTHITALMEGAGMLAKTDDLEVRIPPLWRKSPDIIPFAMRNLSEDFNTSTDREDAKLAKALHGLGCTRYRLNMPIDPATWPDTYEEEIVPPNWDLPATKPRAIIGIIDDGLPFIHRAFLDDQGSTRFSLCWLQGARAEATAQVPFGKEISNRAIDALREGHGRNEIRAYQEAGAIDRDLPELDTVLMHHATHGAHISGIAAGNDPFVGAHALPDDTPIIAVQLPNTIAWDTSGFGKEMMMLSAIEYIFNRAKMIADIFDGEEIPLVINFSYGWSANRHDGESSFERAVETLLLDRKKLQPSTELVMPTGNNYANDMHARFSAEDANDGKISFGWQIKPDDRTSSYLEIWLPRDFGPKGWTVTVTPPHGISLEAGDTIAVSADPALTGGDPRRFTELEMDGHNIGQLSADKHLNNRWRVMLALIPTSTRVDPPRRSPVGLWTITVDTGSTPLPDGHYLDVWVQRDDDPTQLGTGGQQSYLVDLRYPALPRVLDPKPLSPVRGFGCLNGIGTAPPVFRIAGYTQTTQNPSGYSGAASIGWDGDEPVVGPEVPSASAVADQGSFRPGLPSIGVFSGSGARIVGTSAAAATATRLIALNFIARKRAENGFEAIEDAEGASALEKARRVARTGDYRVPPVCSVSKHKDDEPLTG